MCRNIRYEGPSSGEIPSSVPLLPGPEARARAAARRLLASSAAGAPSFGATAAVTPAARRCPLLLGPCSKSLEVPDALRPEPTRRLLGSSAAAASSSAVTAAVTSVAVVVATSRLLHSLHNRIPIPFLPYLQNRIPIPFLPYPLHCSPISASYFCTPFRLVM